jgi:hypothetical protein
VLRLMGGVPVLHPWSEEGNCAIKEPENSNKPRILEYTLLHFVTDMDSLGAYPTATWIYSSSSKQYDASREGCEVL